MLDAICEKAEACTSSLMSLYGIIASNTMLMWDSSFVESRTVCVVMNEHVLSWYELHDIRV